MSEDPRLMQRGLVAASWAVVAVLGLAGPACAPEGEPPAAGEDVAPAFSALTPPPKPAHPVWPTLGGADFGTVGQAPVTATLQFYGPAGAMRAAVTTGANIYSVVAIETYTLTTEYVGTDPGDLPPGHKAPPPSIAWVTTLDTHVDGPGPVTVASGELVSVIVREDPSTGGGPGTLSLMSDGGGTVAVPLAVNPVFLKTSFDVATVTIAQGRSADVGLTLQSVNVPDTTIYFDFLSMPAGITCSNGGPVTIPRGQTIHASLHFVVGSTAALGRQNVVLGYLTGGPSTLTTLGTLAITVTGPENAKLNL